MFWYGKRCSMKKKESRKKIEVASLNSSMSSKCVLMMLFFLPFFCLGHFHKHASTSTRTLNWRHGIPLTNEVNVIFGLFSLFFFFVPMTMKMYMKFRWEYVLIRHCCGPILFIEHNTIEPSNFFLSLSLSFAHYHALFQHIQKCKTFLFRMKKEQDHTSTLDYCSGCFLLTQCYHIDDSYTNNTHNTRIQFTWMDI